MPANFVVVGAWIDQHIYQFELQVLVFIRPGYAQQVGRHVQNFGRGHVAGENLFAQIRVKQMADAPDVPIAGVAFVGPFTAPGPGRDSCGGLAQRIEEIGRDGAVDEEIALCSEVFELLLGEHGSCLPGAWQKNVDESSRELKL